MPYDHDRTGFPIVIDRTIGESTDGDVQEYFAAHERLFQQSTPYVSIMDARQGKMMRPEHRKMMAAWIVANKEALRVHRLGLAFVSESRIIRGMLTATYWLSPPSFPYRIVGTMDEALAWARELLAGR